MGKRSVCVTCGRVSKFQKYRRFRISGVIFARLSALELIIWLRYIPASLDFFQIRKLLPWGSLKFLLREDTTH